MRISQTLLALALAACPLADGVARAAPQGYTIPRSEVVDIVSRAGAEYRIFIAWPEAPPPPGGYPILYLLDGEDNFAVAAETARRIGRFSNASRMTPGIIVGVGYAGASRRSLDYTPAAPVQPTGRSPGMGDDPTGGAPAFRTFLLDELRPFIEKRFAIDRGRQTLMGHSYGGLFVLDTLFERPDAFSLWVASSPSIWFGDKVVLSKEAGFLAHVRIAKLHPRLLLTVGEYEQPPQPDIGRAPAGTGAGQRVSSRRMVDNSHDLAARLGKAGISVRYSTLR